MLRKFIFHVVATGEEVILPVTPQRYRVETGQGTQVVNLTQFGDYALAGNPSIFAFTVECMIPAQIYPFALGGASNDPKRTIAFFERMVQEKQIVRFVVSDTLVSREVLVERIEWGEQDGTNDVYATLTLLPYRRLAPAQEAQTLTSSTYIEVQGEPRTGDAPQVTQQSYRIQRGDTLWGICRRFYGDGALAGQLAQYNGVKNPNLIYDGALLDIPDKSLLGGGAG